MKAVIYEKYGPPEVLALRDVDKPGLKDTQVMVKVHAASVNPLDWHLLRGKPFLVRLAGFGLFKPKRQVLGADVAGVVDSVGEKVTLFKPGDEVFGACNLGGFAEYAAVREDLLAHKPGNLSLDEASTLNVAGLTALQALRDHGKIKEGQKVLINGASGGVGTFAVQIAKAYGAHVTGVCSTRSLDLVRSLGADEVIDYTADDVTTSNRRFHLIIDAAAYRSIFDYKSIMAKDGIYVMVGGEGVFQGMVVAPLISVFGSKKFTGMLTKPVQSDLLQMKQLVETGKVRVVIDRTYPLSEVPEAIRYVEKGHSRGKVVIRVAGS